MDNLTGKSRMNIDSLLNPIRTEYTSGKAHAISQLSSNQPYGTHQTYYSTSSRPVSVENIQTGFHSASGSQQQHQDGPRQSHHPISMGSSPKPYHFIERPGDNSTDLSHVTGSKYNDEEMHFIWYHHVDLSQDWEMVLERFNRQFPCRQRIGAPGMKCTFHRFAKEKGIKRAYSNPKSFMECTKILYTWMREDHKTAITLQKHL